MRIAINGTGIAGPTLAWWLRRYGHEPVLFEKSSLLRTGGYVIDFWGAGYAVAERMGIVSKLRELGYDVQELRLVSTRGRTVATTKIGAYEQLLKGRYFSIARGDIASTIYRACDGIETRFGCSIVGLERDDAGVSVWLSDGTEDRFDLVAGCDGLHSKVRELAFGPEAEFEHDLGFRVAVFTCQGYEPREELVYVSCAAPGRQIARFPLRDGRTMFMLSFRSDLLRCEPENEKQIRSSLRAVFGGMGWEAETIIDSLDDADELYYDRVSQIRMDRWSNGRIVLVGDSGACVSLLAGEGAGLAMLEAYTLAGELHRAGGNYTTAFEAYEQRLRDELKRKQDQVRHIAGFFAPKNKLGVFIRTTTIKMLGLPVLGPALASRMFQDRVTLENYD